MKDARVINMYVYVRVHTLILLPLLYTPVAGVA
jgi:hypothetical protein